MEEPYTGFFAAIFNQHVAELLHDATAVGIVEIGKGIGLAVILYVTIFIIHSIRLWLGSDTKHVSFSINYIDASGTLKLRPIGREIGIEELFTNYVLRRVFRRAFKRTTAENPIMEFPPKYESAIMSTLQSYISDDFSDGFLKAAAGLPVCGENYVIMATFEHYGVVPVRKIRVTVTHIRLLNNLPHPDTLTFEKSHQVARLQTLGLVAVRYNFMGAERQANHVVEIVFDANHPAPDKSKTPA